MDEEINDDIREAEDDIIDDGIDDDLMEQL